MIRTIVKSLNGLIKWNTFSLRLKFICTKKNCQVSGGNLIKFSIFEKCSTRCFCESLAAAIDEICLVRSFQWNTLPVLWPHLNHSECTLRIALPYSLGNFFPHFASHYRPNENLITESLQHIYTSHFRVFAVNLCLFELEWRKHCKDANLRERMYSKFALYLWCS